MRIFRAALAALGAFYDNVIPPRISDRSRAHGLCGDGPEAVSSRTTTTAPASGHPGTVLTDEGLREANDRLQAIADGYCLQRSLTDDPFFGPFLCTRPRNHDGDHVATHVGSGQVYAEWSDPVETSAVTPPAAEDDPGASSPLAPGSPADDWIELPRGYHDEADEFSWVRWVIPAITRALRSHRPMQLFPDGPILCARADSTPCAECVDWEAWVDHVAPGVAVGIRSAAAAES